MAPLSRVLRIKDSIHPNLKARILNMTSPEAILLTFKNQYCHPDILVPNQVRKVSDCRLNPGKDTKEEELAFSCIHQLIQLLQTEELLPRLDFSTISMCLSRLSPARQDKFEEAYITTIRRFSPETSSGSRDEGSIKRKFFMDIIDVQIVLFHRKKVLSNTYSGEPRDPRQPREAKLKAREDAMTKREATLNTRLTKLDRRQNNKSQDKESSPRVKPEDYKCPLCNLTAGHPLPPSSFRKSTGFQSLARCPDLLQASQNQKLAKVQNASSCTMCLSTWHSQTGCNFSPDSTNWLAEQYHGSGCNSWHTHCPRLCPKLSKEQVENLNKTLTKHTIL